VGTGGAIAYRQPRPWLRSPFNAIGNAIGAWLGVPPCSGGYWPNKHVKRSSRIWSFLRPHREGSILTSSNPPIFDLLAPLLVEHTVFG
jgi:hypothetical protein